MPSPLVRVLLGTLLCLLILSPLTVAAHAVLVEARPGDGERLGQSPSELELRFSEPVVPVAVRLLDARGAEISDVTVEPRGGTLIVRPLTPLPEGSYLLSYRVTSVDSHPVGATLRFGIGVEPLPEQGGAATAEPASTRWAGLLMRWLVYVTALGAAGLALFVEAVQPPEPVRSRTGRLLGWLAAAGIAALMVRLGIAGLELVGLQPTALVTSLPWTAVVGTTLAWATAVAILGLAVLILSGRRRRWMRLLGAVLVAGSFALTGHAATAAPRWLAAPTLGLHTLCGAFWLASLVPLLWCVRLAPDKAYLALRRFSAVATVAVAALMVAGVCLAWLQLGGRLAPLWQTSYGLRLTGKLVLVAGLLALAAVNRFLLTPRMARDDPDARRHLGRTLAVDLALGLGVLAVTASFPFDPPPRAMAGRDTGAGGVAIVAAAPGGQATLTLVPGRPGANRLEAWATDTSGAPITAKEATVAVALPEAGIEPNRFRATMPRAGVYVAEGLAMPRAGSWRLRLDLLVDDFTKLTFEGEIVIGEEHDHDTGDHHHPRNDMH
jgi:copper transport protein